MRVVLFSRSVISAILMFVLLFSFAFCYFPFQHPVIEGTTDNWVSEVSEYVANSGVCFIMFVQKRSPRCKAIFPDFQEAANKSVGMVKYISVDIKEHPKVAYLYTVRAVPAFRIVHPKGDNEYKGDTSSESLIEAPLKYIPNKAKLIDESWLPSPTAPMSAILFTNKKIVPALWAAISCNYESDKMRIGFTRSPQLMSNVAPPGSIVFIYKDIVSIYNGQLTYFAVTQAMKAFEEDPKASGTSVSLVTEIRDREQFEQSCRNTGKICIFEVKRSDSKFEEIAKTNHHGPFRFHKCDDKCPFDGMANYVIFHGKRNNIISVESIDDLPGALDRVLDGGAKWVPFPDNYMTEL